MDAKIAKEDKLSLKHPLFVIMKGTWLKGYPREVQQMLLANKILPE